LLKSSLSNSTVEAATQTRKQVRKDIWISEPNNQRLQTRLDSETSILTLQPNGSHLEIVEDLFDIRCWSQEKAYTSGSTPMYQMRFLEAKEGSYKHRTQTFKASNTLLSLYRIPGLFLITNLQHHQPFLSGQAEEVSLSIQHGTPHFEALQFKAALSSGAKP